MAINAIRLRTPDPPDGQGRYRYLQAANGGGAGLFAVPVASPAQWETFLFEPPTTFPLVSGAQLSMNLCNSNWDASGMLVRVDHGVHTSKPSNKKDPPLVTYEIGGPGQAVWVTTGFPAGYPAYPGDDPQERIFDIIKSGGGQINSNDLVSLRINSNLGKTFFFRVAGTDVWGDGAAAGQADTNFIVEFVEVRSGLGVCGTVNGTVTRATGGQAIQGAQVEALNASGNPLFSITTQQNGTYTLPPNPVTMCIPAGNIKVRASANRFKTKTIDPVLVPGGGSVNVPIQLDCTEVKVKVVDGANLGMAGVSVMLLDTSDNILLDLNGQPYLANTGLDGSVTFSCVPHGSAKAQATTLNATQVLPVNVSPGGTTVTIIFTCGNLIGKVVTDLISQTGIPNASVTIAGTTLQTTTDANGNFRFNCVQPPGQKTVLAMAPGCGSNTRIVNVPTSGNSQQVVIPLNCSAVVVDKIVAILQWDAQPSDLDAHLSGPDGQGGRFHLFFVNQAQPPVPYASLSTDDTTAFGPEVLTISKAPRGFVPGDYHVWIHNYTGSTFAGSSAVVTVLRMDPQGVPTQLSRQEVEFATGNQADDLWHVVNLDVGAAGSVAVTVVQTLQPGNSSNVL
jgi:hypothetical protein